MTKHKKALEDRIYYILLFLWKTTVSKELANKKQKKKYSLLFRDSSTCIISIWVLKQIAEVQFLAYILIIPNNTSFYYMILIGRNDQG